jgi:hypothetical protein
LTGEPLGARHHGGTSYCDVHLEDHPKGAISAILNLFGNDSCELPHEGIEIRTDDALPSNSLK